MKTATVRRQVAWFGEILALPRNALFAPLNRWLDRLTAARYARRLCRRFSEQREIHAAAAGEALYVEVVKADLGVSADQAREIVDRAAESYADWPMPRAVTFRDVVRYLVAVRLSERQGWVEGQIKTSVNSQIPSRW